MIIVYAFFIKLNKYFETSFHPTLILRMRSFSRSCEKAIIAKLRTSLDSLTHKKKLENEKSHALAGVIYSACIFPRHFCFDFDFVLPN